MINPPKHTPRWIVFLIDLVICLFSITFSFFVRFEFSISEEYRILLKSVIPLVLFIRAVHFLSFRTFAGLIRYTSTKDAERIFVVTSVSTFVLFVINFINFFISSRFIIPNSILLIDYFLTIILMVGSRLFYKTLYYTIRNSDLNSEKILIVGVEQFAAAVKRAIDRESLTGIQIVGFIDPYNKQEGNKIENIEIYNIGKIEYLIQKHDVAKVILATKNLDPNRKNKIIEKCLNLNVSVQTIPDANAWINGELNVKQIKNIKIEDLLERPPIVLDKKRIQDYIKGKVVLVTGAAGSIGSEMVRQITRFRPNKIILFDVAETPLYELELELKETFQFFDFETVIGSVTNEYRVNRLFEAFKPQVVFHAAAYKHVPMMENNPTEAVFNNVLGTKLVADIAVKFHVEKFVMISTDKAVNPTNVMGASKRIAEIYTQTLNYTSQTKFITTRFGNVLGSNGSVIPRFKKQIENGGPITITHPDIIRYFMTIPEACQLVLEAGAMGQGGEIFIFDMGKPVKILDLAKKMIKLSGLTYGKDIQISFTGLRPGEKLFEELLNNKENTIPTYHPKIMIAKVNEYKQEEVMPKIMELLNTLPSHNNFRIVSIMKDIVPEFVSRNSIFEEIDQQKKYRNEQQSKTA
ncbi:polysaccharide biosynthesis protein [Tenuifilum sp.]|uniref:polysaccharide biosynthesis protein n=1 Tax=Tenuifilum sp. TaxID=2760880 RepID=UPI002C650B36|nr:nucleoside-diphosphate sugar epimerase/dehydratase [Tenuifilum sp.]HPP90632.1 nucleoside-diphosphate sugar epimerase/dehydratase [Tenuifilum sp.]HRR12027.1 nucleoside-diphosphate sugar epimerase/dehydratase [Tenuifilum sp.]HRS44659.1 nucleoside-diphosphate sugar epimerase/dehydratase [Tenuifilum sp.]